MGNAEIIYKYWGKADKDGDYHLLVYHSLDVAAVGKVWLEKCPDFVKRASNASGLSRKAFVEWFVFFLALHDIGKFSFDFQNLCPAIREKLHGGKKIVSVYSTRHDQKGFVYYNELLFDQFHSSYFDEINATKLKEFFDLFAKISFGHHGIPPKVDSIRKVPDSVSRFTNSLYNLFISAESRTEIIAILQSPKSVRKKIILGFKLFTWQLAGFTTICDWIASGDEVFVFLSDEMDLDEYFSGASKKATIAVKRAEIMPATLSKEQGLGRLFPDFVNSPSPLQKFCNETPIKDEPQLWILEDVTGAGKTEAALTLASRILGTGCGSGCFIALPTMATSNAMYERMAKVYTKLYHDESHPSLTLSHGSRHLSETFKKSYRDNFTSVPHEGECIDDELDEGRAHCSQWLADTSKKALLADVGVGTIDQLLLAGLPVRYQSIRAFGLSNKVLVIDEVHAFDAYMLRLLENIITVQAAFGGATILLSATLPFSVREKFCKAFSLGLDIRPVQLKKQDVFPLVTSLTSSCLLEEGVDTRKPLIREVAVELREDIEEIYKLIEKSIRHGHCVCWIRNTITDVISSFKELQHKRVNNLDLFHSRFALSDRLKIEKRVLKRFGLNSTCEEREGQVLIASQVVEQSLDLDFDVLISDLAPIDLLIQRAGRLHRHNRANRTKPIFYVYTPIETKDPSTKWYADTFPHAQWVYRDAALLWRTNEVLRKQKRLKLPDEARFLIESVYGDIKKFEQIETPSAFSSSEDNAWAETMNKSSLANFNRIKFEQGYCRMSNDNGKWESDERVSTRLSEPTNRIYLCRWLDGEIISLYSDKIFQWDLSSLTLPKNVLESIDNEEEVQNAINHLKKQKRFRYDTLFLVFLNDDMVLTGSDKNGTQVEVKYGDNGLILTKLN